MYMNIQVKHINELIDGNLPYRILDNTDYCNPTMLTTSWEDNCDEIIDKYEDWNIVDIARPTDTNTFCIDIFIEKEN